jgi:hypothetical protein
MLISSHLPCMKHFWLQERVSCCTSSILCGFSSGGKIILFLSINSQIRHSLTTSNILELVISCVVSGSSWSNHFCIDPINYSNNTKISLPLPDLYWISICLAISSRFSLPNIFSPSSSANANAVPGPCDVVKFPSWTTAWSETLASFSRKAGAG